MTEPFSRWLRDSCSTIWHQLHAHPFLREMARGTLAPASLRFYLEQDGFYLAEYARCMAIGAGMSGDIREVGWFRESLDNVVDNEIPRNLELLERVVATGAPDRGGAAAIAPATLAYSSFPAGDRAPRRRARRDGRDHAMRVELSRDRPGAGARNRVRLDLRRLAALLRRRLLWRARGAHEGRVRRDGRRGRRRSPPAAAGQLSHRGAPQARLVGRRRSLLPVAGRDGSRRRRRLGRRSISGASDG